MEARRPLTKLESKVVYTIRFKPSEWAVFEQAARALGIEVRKYVREVALTGHSVEQAGLFRQGHTRVSA